MTTAEKRSEQPSLIPVSPEDLRYIYYAVDGIGYALQQNGKIAPRWIIDSLHESSENYVGIAKDEDFFDIRYQQNQEKLLRIPFSQIQNYLRSGSYCIVGYDDTRADFVMSLHIVRFERREEPVAPAPRAQARAAVTATLDRSPQTETSQTSKIYALLGPTIQKAVTAGKFTKLQAAAIAKKLGYPDAIALLLKPAISIQKAAETAIGLIGKQQQALSGNQKVLEDIASILRIRKEPELRAYLGIPALELPNETPEEQLDRELMLEKFQERLQKLLDIYNKKLIEAREDARSLQGASFSSSWKPFKDDPYLESSLRNKTKRRRNNEAFSSPENSWLQVAVTRYWESVTSQRADYDSPNHLPYTVLLLEFLQKLTVEKLTDFLDPDEIAAMQKGIDINLFTEGPTRVTLIDKYGRPDLEGIYKFIAEILQTLFNWHAAYQRAEHLSYALLGHKQLKEESSSEKPRPIEALNFEVKLKALEGLTARLHEVISTLEPQINLQASPIIWFPSLKCEVLGQNSLDPKESSLDSWHKRVEDCYEFDERRKVSKYLPQSHKAYLLLQHLYKTLRDPKFLHPAQRAMMQRGEEFRMPKIQTEDTTPRTKIALLNEDSTPNLRGIRDYIAEILCKGNGDITEEQARQLLEPLDEAFGETTNLKIPAWTRFKAWKYRVGSSMRAWNNSY